MCAMASLNWNDNGSHTNTHDRNIQSTLAVNTSLRVRADLGIHHGPAAGEGFKTTAELPPLLHCPLGQVARAKETLISLRFVRLNKG